MNSEFKGSWDWQWPEIGTSREPGTVVMDVLTAANNCFALDLCLKLCEEKRTENVFFSPLSISTALAMVFLGAKGSTNQQMAKVRVMNGLCWSR
ncbi:hypothetical protein chiPu_0009327 [Chiloscyllium punctatum]|uniref:Serpin domain-containing protein n=1 Tax=Chiloscyllium punctatum TaxID=137246 RepID=A0A401SKF2_CHIPU|nr:hypothetical protein [Chiloscyllium punctatum]